MLSSKLVVSEENNKGVIRCHLDSCVRAPCILIIICNVFAIPNRNALICRTLRVSSARPRCCRRCGCCCCCGWCCWSGTADKLRRLLTNSAFQSGQRKISCVLVIATNKFFSSYLSSRKDKYWHSKLKCLYCFSCPFKNTLPSAS